MTSPTSISCGKCSTAVSLDRANDWMKADPPLIVQGVAIGICPRCVGGYRVLDEEEPEHCDHQCGGTHRSTLGIYYVAITSTDDDQWSCWDVECCNWWAENEAPVDCYACGSEIDVSIKRFRNGEYDGKVEEPSRYEENAAHTRYTISRVTDFNGPAWKIVEVRHGTQYKVFGSYQDFNEAIFILSKYIARLRTPIW